MTELSPSSLPKGIGYLVIHYSGVVEWEAFSVDLGWILFTSFVSLGVALW